MHIIFENLTSWQVPISRLFKYLKFEVYCLSIEANSDFKKNEVAKKLKEKNIFPLPLEKKIIPGASFFSYDCDPEEIAYKKNIKLVPDRILKKYCNLFSVNEKKINKLRLLLQEFISFNKNTVSGHLGIWAALYPEKKIIYVSFKFKCFYNSDAGKNIFNIVIPIDILSYFIRVFKNISLLFFH